MKVCIFLLTINATNMQTASRTAWLHTSLDKTQPKIIWNNQNKIMNLYQTTRELLRKIKLFTIFSCSDDVQAQTVRLAVWQTSKLNKN